MYMYRHLAQHLSTKLRDRKKTLVYVFALKIIENAVLVADTRQEIYHETFICHYRCTHGLDGRSRAKMSQSEENHNSLPYRYRYDLARLCSLPCSPGSV